MAVSYGLSKVGLEVYTTTDKDEEEKKKEEEKNKDSEKESDSTSDKKEEDKTPEIISPEIGEEGNKFKLENAPIKQINYIGELYSDSFEQDYTDIISNASISVPITYLKYFYKGRKVCLKKGIQNDTKYKWKDMKSAVLGFVTEITYNNIKVDVRINGMDKLLDVEKQFTFKQTKRSEIVTKIIEAAGLKADVNVKGLVDDVTDFTNVSSSGSSDNTSGQSTGSATIDEAVENAIKGITDPLAKAKAIDRAFKSHVIYNLYWDCDYPNDLDAAWKDGTLNCADGANILCAMFLKAGLSAVILHVPPEYSEGYGHYIVKVTIGGKEYFTDNAASSGYHTSRPFGEVFGQPIGSEVGTRISG